ncbi:DUF302 domain-containing protein [Nocardia sp. CDC160]|uniref:DUF302 domain-containing protein n=1 Tax=Nocardia sp. CDC160 TaxID=3112166 RepID=UPI002DB80B8A|nr:DUF302 domain-containing protein [Nocardia sp. CDC160]MEC3918689.1 DUF302 domain-containing protein [Nocardia sp. CDC160]
MKYRVGLCETAPQTVLRIPLEIRPDKLSEGIVAGMVRVAQIAEQAGLTASGAPTITFHRELPSDDAIIVDFGLPIEAAPTLGPSSGAELVVQAPTLVARTCHRGSYGDLDAAYRALRDWVHVGGYRPIGPPTEAYLIGPDEVSDPRQLITEVRIPVAPAPAIAAHLDGDFATAVEQTRDALRQQGFGVLSELDMQAILREKVGEHIEDYLILEVCNPRLAAQALAADRQAGLMLPCPVVLRTDETGVLVEAADPEVQVRVLVEPELLPVAAEARRLLVAALDSLHSPAAAAG